MDFIPSTDEAFDPWFDAYNTYVQINFAALGFTAAQAATLATAWADWSTAYKAGNAATLAAQAAVRTKNDKRTLAEDLLRPFTALIQARPQTTDAQRRSLDITVPGENPTPQGEPTSRPVAQIENAHRLEHRISWRDEATPTSRAKPRGAMGAEIWLKLGLAPTGPNDPELRFLGLDTASPYVTEFADADAGKTAFYLLRWVNSTGKGPWSPTASATVTA